MKTFSKASDDLTATIRRMQRDYHPELKGVTVAARFEYEEGSDKEGMPCHKHQGYPAAASIKITSPQDRVLDAADAIITVDRVTWQSFTAVQKDALIDHELTHLTRDIDEDTGLPLVDAVSRPKLKARLHDHQIGIFREVMERHGRHAIDTAVVAGLMSDVGQLSLDFFGRPGAQQERASSEGVASRIGGTPFDIPAPEAA